MGGSKEKRRTDLQYCKAASFAGAGPGENEVTKTGGASSSVSDATTCQVKMSERDTTKSVDKKPGRGISGEGRCREKTRERQPV